MNGEANYTDSNRAGNSNSRVEQLEQQHAEFDSSFSFDSPTAAAGSSALASSAHVYHAATSASGVEHDRELQWALRHGDGLLSDEEQLLLQEGQQEHRQLHSSQKMPEMEQQMPGLGGRPTSATASRRSTVDSAALRRSSQSLPQQQHLLEQEQHGRGARGSLDLGHSQRLSNMQELARQVGRSSSGIRSPNHGVPSPSGPAASSSRFTAVQQWQQDTEDIVDEQHGSHHGEAGDAGVMPQTMRISRRQQQLEMSGDWEQHNNAAAATAAEAGHQRSRRQACPEQPAATAARRRWDERDHGSYHSDDEAEAGPQHMPPRRSSSSRSPAGGRSSSAQLQQQPAASPDSRRQQRQHHAYQGPDAEDASEVADDDDVLGTAASGHTHHTQQQRQGSGRWQQSPNGSGRHGSPSKPARASAPGLYRYAQPVFEGDLSEWGKRELPGFYDEDAASEASGTTLSSGVGPAAGRRERGAARPFELEAAQEALSYQAGMYTRAQALRRGGVVPAALGLADDLPTRMAYEQLNILAGMAGKVQDAILHNRRIFEQRLVLEQRSLLKRAWQAWRGRRQHSAAKQALLLRVANKLARGMLARVFYTWRDELHLVDKTFAMRRKLASVLKRGLLKRSFEAWLHLCADRQWKVQLGAREREVAALEAKLRGFERRPVQVLRKRRLSALLGQWLELAEQRRGRRMRMLKAAHHFQAQQHAKAWRSWLAFVEERQHASALMRKAAGRIRTVKLAQAWQSWHELLQLQRGKLAAASKAMGHWHNTQLLKAWRGWQAHQASQRDKHRITSRWRRPLLAKAFAGWAERVAWRKRMQLILEHSARKLLLRRQLCTLLGWYELVQWRKAERDGATVDSMQERLQQTQAENERLRRDNERFVRLIDSGEWGRGRVQELVTAGEVLSSERDALLQLIQSLRHEYEAVQAAKVSQEEELRQLKERMLGGGPLLAGAGGILGSSPAARNQMLIKGGSSFNALVRAMKQDLLEGPGAAAAAAGKGAGLPGGVGSGRRSPGLLYEVDQLSLDRVVVKGEGEIDVQALAARPAPGATIGRPSTPGGGHSTSSISAMPGCAGRALARAAVKLGPGGYSSSGGAQSLGLSGRASSAVAVLSGALRTSAAGPATPGSRSPAGSRGGSAGGAGAGSAAAHKVVAALSSLGPAEVQKLQAVLGA